jgi:hypothetical protein
MRYDSLSAFAVEEREVLAKMQDLVEGEPLSLDVLGYLPGGGTNEKALRKVCQSPCGLGGEGLMGAGQVYKLNQDGVLAGVVAGSPEARRALDELCVGAVALKVVT